MTEWATHHTGSSSAGTWLRNSLWANIDRRDDDAAGSAGVREPRRPVQPSDHTGEARALPRHDDAPPAYMTIIGGF